MYNLYKALSILVSMYLPQINEMYTLSLDSKLVGKVIIVWKINNQSDTHGWEVKAMLFNAIVTQVLLYGVDVWEAPSLSMHMKRD